MTKNYAFHAVDEAQHKILLLGYESSIRNNTFNKMDEAQQKLFYETGKAQQETIHLLRE